MILFYIAKKCVFNRDKKKGLVVGGRFYFILFFNMDHFISSLQQTASKNNIQWKNVFESKLQTRTKRKGLFSIILHASLIEYFELCFVLFLLLLLLLIMMI